MKIEWSEGRWFPVNVKAGAVGVVDGRVVYVGGMTHPWRESEVTWQLDPEVGDWMPIPPIPVGRCYTKGTTTRHGLVVIGGRKSGAGAWANTLGDAWLLSREGGDWQWRELPPLNTPRAECGMAAVGDLVICAGGGNWEKTKGGAFTAEGVTTCEVLDMNDPASGWKVHDFPFATRSSCAAAAVDGRFILFGGYDCHVAEDGTRAFTHFNDVLALHPASGEWEALPSLPFKLSGHDAVAWKDGTVVLLGGCVRYNLLGQEVLHHTLTVRPKVGVVGGYSDLAWLYDVATGECSAIEGRMPAGLNDLRAVANGENIVVVGGENVDTTTSNTSNAVAVGEVEG